MNNVHIKLKQPIAFNILFNFNFMISLLSYVHIILFSDFTKLVIKVIDHRYSLQFILSNIVSIKALFTSSLIIIHDSLLFYFCQCQNF